MTAPVVDERAHWAVVSAAITASLGVNRVFAHGKVPGLDNNAGTLPPIFAVLSVTRRFAPTAKSSRRADSSGWRVSVITAGRTVDEAAWASLRVAEALEDVRLTIDGHVSTPIHFESSRDIKADSERLSGVSVWTYAF